MDFQCKYSTLIWNSKKIGNELTLEADQWTLMTSLNGQQRIQA